MFGLRTHTGRYGPGTRRRSETGVEDREVAREETTRLGTRERPLVPESVRGRKCVRKEDGPHGTRGKTRKWRQTWSRGAGLRVPQG